MAVPEAWFTNGGGRVTSPSAADQCRPNGSRKGANVELRSHARKKWVQREQLETLPPIESCQ